MAVFINSILIVIAIAFYTIVERKILGLIILRVGPNKPSFLGLLTPFADAGKLLIKYKIKLKIERVSFTYIGPILGFTLMLCLWSLFPYFHKERAIWGLLWFLLISGLGVYRVFFRGWGSNSKFSLLGAIRGIAQTISYEITLSLLIFSIAINVTRFNFDKFYQYPSLISWSWFLLMLWMISCLIETNRAPFDLVEGESELVSGFNTEYGSFKFALLFLGEYGTIIFLSYITRVIFFSNLTWVCFPLMIIFYIWARSAFPRLKYNDIIIFRWKILLPLTLRLLSCVILMISICVHLFSKQKIISSGFKLKRL